MSVFSRRALLATAAAAPLAGLAARPTRAQSQQPEPMAIPTTDYRRVKLGDFEVTTLLAGTRAVPDPHSIFGLDVSDEAFAEASEQANIPTEKAQFFFTPTLVNTGSELVLFDTGLNAQGISAALQAAGRTTDDIDVVVITHMHGDHIGGLADDAGTPTFANARYVTGATEYDHWASAGNEDFDTKVRPLSEKMEMIQGGHSVASGIESMEAFGHTPGHMVYRLENSGQTLIIAADFANHYVWSLAHPEWEVKFDMNQSAAAVTRKELLAMMAADKTPFIGYHMPFPAIGYVNERDGGYGYEPMSYQLML